ncbi:hypothetical protein BC827DRAFT_501702 [Russula dissimulans]|nr:hypothetical protein BC827DRAFT_501702 [Russula dissimulans]
MDDNQAKLVFGRAHAIYNPLGVTLPSTYRGGISVLRNLYLLWMPKSRCPAGYPTFLPGVAQQRLNGALRSKFEPPRTGDDMIGVTLKWAAVVGHVGLVWVPGTSSPQRPFRGTAVPWHYTATPAHVNLRNGMDCLTCKVMRSELNVATPNLFSMFRTTVTHTRRAMFRER